MIRVKLTLLTQQNIITYKPDSVLIDIKKKECSLNALSKDDSVLVKVLKQPKQIMISKDEKDMKKESSDAVSSQSDDGAVQKKKGKAAKGKRIKCVLCSKTFASRHTLNLHYDLTHTVKRYTCDECGKEYTSGAHKHST